MDIKYRKGIFFVTYYLTKSNKPVYLLQKRKLHWKGWEFPKAGVNKLESKKHALRRELKEETGLAPIKIINHKIKGKYKYPKELDDRKGIGGQTYILFSVQVKKGKLKLDKKEHYSAKWLTFDKALKIITHPNQKKCLRIVNKFLTQ
ncbi:NUDIX domain-containing protein [archaeon]|jgi:8-oxo-dGTP pyrophosphatase MutT (NUDIX family)|nr:NUDIX domain-containing protein [archaeon]